ncbi:MAG: disulfide oxidoreductase [Actinomycetota bacterium]
MTPLKAQLFFATLTLAVLAVAVGLIAIRVMAMRRPSARGSLNAVAPACVPLAALIAVVSMAGSLYFSEVANYLPCTLCWYQRIAMYSLAIILTIAAVRRDTLIRRYSMPLAGIGIVISGYHYLLERFPQLDTGVCNTTIPCEYVWFEKFGFVTLPFMALTGFIAIFVLTSVPSVHTPKE